MGHYLTFDGVSTSTYDIYISEEGVFNAPERDVETITIPGRNGDYQLDKGRFNNITVTYPAFNYESTMANFTQKLSNLRNQFASRVGYKRLTDSLHTDEYRMAIFKGGLEVDPLHYNTASTFDIVFDCKPQRFLTSGETAVTVANNGTITNPTLFDARPLLAITGYGKVNLGGETIEVTQNILGETVVGGNTSTNSTSNLAVTMDNTYANSGDDIRTSAEFTVGYVAKNDVPVSASVSLTGTGTADYAIAGNSLSTTISTGEMSFVYGTSKTVSNTAVYTVTTEQNVTATLTVVFSVAYNGTTTFTLSSSTTNQTPFAAMSRKKSIADIILDSTKQAGTVYVDLDIGEAYTISNNKIASANNAVILPAELPTLPPGSTTVTYPNTVTQLKITPRWWKI